MNLRKLSAVPLLLPAFMLAAGILAGSFTDAWCIIPPAIAAVIFIIAKRHYPVALCAFFITGGALGLLVVPHAPARSLAGEPITLTGQVTAVSETNSGLMALIKADRCGAADSEHCRPFTVSAYIPDFDVPLKRGAELTFTATLENVSHSREIPDEISYDSYLLSKRIFYKTLIPPDSIKAVAPPTGPRLWFDTMAERLKTEIYRSRLSPDTKVFLAAALIGSDEDLDGELRTRFSTAGIAHILALSGLHVGLIAALIGAALYPLCAFGRNRLRMLLIIAALWLYALLTGASPSVVRAVTMATVFLTGRILSRHHNPFNALMLAAIIILVADPAALFETGFQMSFAAVVCILAFAERINPVDRRRRVLYSICSAIAVSLSAMLGTGLIATYYFHNFPVYFLPANLLIGVIMLPLLASGVAVTLLGSLGASWTALNALTDTLYRAVDSISLFTASLPGAAATDIYFPAWTLLPYGVALVLLYRFASRPTLSRAADTMAVICITVIIAGAGKKEREPAIYISSDYLRTDIIADTGHGPLRMFTTAKGHRHDEALDQRRRSLSSYMGQRGIDSLILHPDNESATSAGGAIRAGNVTIGLAAGPTGRLNGKMDYLIISRGSRARLSTLERHIAGRPVIILSSDLDTRIAERYRLECISAGRDYISLSEAPVKISLTGPSSESPRRK